MAARLAGCARQGAYPDSGGLPGPRQCDVRSVGAGVSELRIDYGPGYRVYFASRGKTIVVLLRGGAKQTQDDDIATAKALAKELDNGA